MERWYLMGRPVKETDKYRERLLKNIPSEVLGVFVATNGIFLSMVESPAVAQWLVFGVCLVATPFWLYFFQDVKGPAQIVMATLAFVVWVMSIEGPFTSIEGYQTYIGSISVILLSGLIAPIVTKFAK
jgi:hypothetical protein